MRTVKFALLTLAALLLCQAGFTPAAFAAGKVKQLTLVTGSSGGTYYALGGAMASVWNKHLESKGIMVSSVSSGASVENMNLLHNGEADLGMAMNNVADAAWKGGSPFKEKMNKFLTLGVVYPEVYQIVAAAYLKAEKLSDLRGKRVAVGPVGSGTAVITELLLKAAGIDMAKEIQVQRDGFGNAASKMKDRHIDASCAVLSVPASSIVELKTSMELSYINVSDAELAKLREDYPFFTRFSIPPGTYSNTASIETITCQAALYCRADLDEETAYQLTKVFYEYGREVAAAHAAGKYIQLKTALDGITTPLHPGAIRYYKEKNLSIPALIMK
ncbi:MAG: TAXI family TRAP transporter solute-binding subunit [Desulfovibrio sp.]|jgi:TRAP transporter TAXI family solute receptor|nr:TAXI family TRAP transporter solute-binding subunit [Desulfovibrio sp.]